MNTQHTTHNTQHRLLYHLAILFACIFRFESNLNAFEISANVGEVDDSIGFAFCIKNTSENPITIKSIKKSCDCHSLQIREGDVIPPLSVAEISLSIGATQAGVHEGSVTFATDSLDPRFAMFKLNLKGEIKPQYSVMPRRIDLVYGAKSSVVVRAIAPDLLGKFVKSESAYGVLKIDDCTVITSENKLVINVSAPFASSSTQLNARDALIIRFAGLKTQSIIVPVSIVLGPNPISEVSK
jgi:hypothetical protein